MVNIVRINTKVLYSDIIDVMERIRNMQSELGAIQQVLARSLDFIYDSSQKNKPDPKPTQKAMSRGRRQRQ